MKLPILSSLSLLLFAGSVAGQVLPPDYFFVAGATNYLQTNIDQAKKFVTDGLAFYPQDQKLTNLWALLNQQQQQQQQQDQQDKKDEQQKSDEQKSEQQKSDEQKKQEEQKKQDSQKKDEQKQDQQAQEQKAQDQRGEQPDKSDQQATQARVMQMTPQEAQQLLDVQKSEERAMIFQPQNLRTNRPRDRVFKDW